MSSRGTPRSGRTVAREAPLGAQRGAFTLIDVLVTIAIIGILIAILLPSIAMVQESARRVACSSDMRQFGVGVGMFAEDRQGQLPQSVYLADPDARNTIAFAPHLMDTVRTDATSFDPRPWGQWDGLGLLFAQSYINAPGVFYCPSHQGMSREEDHAPRWSDGSTDTLLSNYQYRGTGPDGQRYLYQIASSAAIVTDTVRSIDELNHDDGFNVLAAGLSVNWFADVNDQVLSSILSRSGGGGVSESSDEDPIATTVLNEWSIFDGNID